MDILGEMRELVRNIERTEGSVFDLSTWLPNSIYAGRAFGDYWDEHNGDIWEVVEHATVVLAAMLYTPTPLDVREYRESGEIPSQWDVLNVDKYSWYAYSEEEQEFTHDSPVHEDYRPEYDDLAKSYRALYNQKLELLRKMANQQENDQ